jgi:maltose alpha-D-glucosyltransferase/alpha-amylase
MAVMKIIRRVSSGLHPQTEMTGYLTEQGYKNIPALLGELVRVDSKGTPHTSVIIERFIRNQGDAWQWTLDALKRAVNPVAVSNGDEETAEDALAPCLALATAIGRRLAELHMVLAKPTDNPAFTPMPVDREEAGRWVDGAIVELSSAFRVLTDFTGWQDEEQRAKAAVLIDRKDQIIEKLHQLSRSGPGALLTRIHGDFHLGQVLVASGDAMLIDFEGEPSKSLEERRTKGCPLRDVAGLLRSFDYAAATLAREPAPASEQTANRRDDLLDRYRILASRQFFESYLDTARSAPHQWFVGDDAAKALTDLFLVQKAAYEISYEAANRPGWIGIPLQGLLDLSSYLQAVVPEKADT